MNQTNKVKAGLVLIVLLICIPLLSGCWDRREVNDLALVMAAALDLKEDHTIELSIQMVVPQAVGGSRGMGGGGSRGGGKNPTTVSAASGISIYDAMAKIQEKVSRKIFWGHNRILLIGEELAEHGINDHIDFMARHPEPRIRANTYICKGRAIEYLTLIPQLEQTGAEMLRELSVFRIGLNITIKDLLVMLQKETGGAVLPWVEILPPGLGQKEPQLNLNGTAVLKEGKLIGHLNSKITRGLLWLRDEIKQAAITITPEEPSGPISFVLLHSKTVLVPTVHNETWKMTVKIETLDDVVENSSKLNVMNPQVIKKLQPLLEQDLNNRIRMVLDKLQNDFNVDVVGFDDVFHRKYPKQFKEAKERWDEIFSEIEVSIESTVKIKRPGSSTVPQGIPEKEVEKE